MVLFTFITRKVPQCRLNFVRTLHSVKKDPVMDQMYLPRQIYQKIKVNGPIPIANFMKEVLTNPLAGYYIHKDMLGEGGDFITSPEITQLFGEMLAVWLINEWQKMGSPKPLQIVELGPGKGTLASDLLKVFNHFKLLQQTNLHLVEVSPHLSELQAKKLCIQNSLTGETMSCYRHGTTNEGIPVQWYKQLSDVPKGFTIFIAHEFFDALPIHKFHMTYKGYKEVLIDIDPNKENSDSDYPRFRYVLAKNPTPMQNVFLNPNEKRNHVEVSPDTVFICKEICERIKFSGGLALICDYGHNGNGTDTFRAFRKHKQVDPLEMPGSADLTADVDFNAIRQVANQVEGILTFGPVNQRDFLLKAGLDFRVKSLKQTIVDKRQLNNINECYKMLTDRDKMGERFKFLMLIPETMKRILDLYPPTGFSEK